jgi:hypothetical protein
LITLATICDLYRCPRQSTVTAHVSALGGFRPSLLQMTRLPLSCSDRSDIARRSVRLASEHHCHRLRAPLPPVTTKPCVMLARKSQLQVLSFSCGCNSTRYIRVSGVRVNARSSVMFPQDLMTYELVSDIEVSFERADPDAVLDWQIEPVRYSEHTRVWLLTISLRRP